MEITLEIKLQAAKTELMSLKIWNFSGQNDVKIDEMELRVAILEAHLGAL
tara:strand:- start:28034 stop:28183 length:150 start_codon:yes stop_codon:yes gene_type:complete